MTHHSFSFVQTFDHMLVAIEDISGQIGDNYMRAKYVDTNIISTSISYY